MAKEFKSNMKRPTDVEVQGMANARYPFKKCVCGNSITAGQQYCWECKRLYDLGMKTPPVGQFVQAHDVDTQERQSYDAFRHDGYSDTQPTKKIDPKKERI